MKLCKRCRHQIRVTGRPAKYAPEYCATCFLMIFGFDRSSVKSNNAYQRRYELIRKQQG